MQQAIVFTLLLSSSTSPCRHHRTPLFSAPLPPLSPTVHVSGGGPRPDPPTPAHPPRRSRRLRVVPVAQRRHRIRPVPRRSPRPRPRRLHRAHEVQARAERQPAVLGRECCFFSLERGDALSLSLSLSSSGEKTTREKREKERRERKSERERESETTVETMRRAIETKTAKSLTPLQNLFFVTLHSTETAARDL